jgi:hypothetical protein
MTGTDYWANEREDLLARFADELRKATGDGSKKRQAGQKPPWYEDPDHEGAVFSHITKWKRGELIDPDSGAHPLVHAAWRLLAIACQESGNVPVVTPELPSEEAYTAYEAANENRTRAYTAYESAIVRQVQEAYPQLFERVRYRRTDKMAPSDHLDAESGLS